MTTVARKFVGRVIHTGPLWRGYQAVSFRRFRPRIDEACARDDLRLHLGSGDRILDGWINVDRRIDRRVLALGLPGGLRRFDDDSTRCIYASHFLEHLDYRTDAVAFARECHRILVPGGTLRVVVPGIEKILRAYVSDDDAFFAVQRTMHPDWCTTKLEHLLYALQQDGEHRYGYDFETMAKLLGHGGFTDVRLSDYDASTVPELRVDYRATTGPDGAYLSLYVDATK